MISLFLYADSTVNLLRSSCGIGRKRGTPSLLDGLFALCFLLFNVCFSCVRAQHYLHRVCIIQKLNNLMQKNQSSLLFFAAHFCFCEY